VGTDKRERQKAGRQTKILEETAAAKRQRTRRTVRNVAIAAVVLLGGAFAYSTLAGGDDDDNDTATENDTTTTAVPETTTTTYSNPEVAAAIQERGKPDPAPPPADTPKDALEITTLIEGEGEGAKAGDTVTVEYVGKTPDGNVFDYSWDNHPPFPLPLGQGQVIAGWEEGLLGAKLGERRRLVIGSDKAYGAEGRPPEIPANTPLVFEVDIIDLAPAG
jgi:FKBP-type peptidyl-prolyl cis-trans isomerase